MRHTAISRTVEPYSSGVRTSRGRGGEGGAAARGDGILFVGRRRGKRGHILQAPRESEEGTHTSSFHAARRRRSSILASPPPRTSGGHAVAIAARSRASSMKGSRLTPSQGLRLPFMSTTKST